MTDLGKPKSCPEHLELNPFTNRCNKKCTSDKERVTNIGKKNFKCYKICKPGSVRHEDTNRCRSLTKNSTRTRRTRKTTRKSPSMSEYFSVNSGEEDLFFSGTPGTSLSYKVGNNFIENENSADFDWWVNRSNGNSIASQASNRSLDGAEKKADFKWWLNQVSDSSRSSKSSRSSSRKGSRSKSSRSSSRKGSHKSSVKGSHKSSLKKSRSSSSRNKSSLTRSSSSEVQPPRRYPQRKKPAPIDRYSPTFNVRKNKTKKKKRKATK